MRLPREHLMHPRGGGPACDPKLKRKRLSLVLTTVEAHVTCLACANWMKLNHW